MPNEELIRTVIKRIERDIEMWSQDSWGHIDAGEPFWNRTTRDVMVQVPAEAHEEGHFAEELAVIPITDMDLLVRPAIASCGTTFCFAGHTVLEAGDAMLVPVDGLSASLCRTPEGKIRHIFHRAAELLGLDADYEAPQLFQAGIYDLDDLKSVITDVTGVTFE